MHQFDKVEMFVYCRPEEAEAEHQRLLGWEGEMLAQIELPYRVIDVAAGDLGSSAARKFDCEAWVPTQQTYRELTSTSNCTTFQARRLSVRYRDDDGKPQTAATLNGTLATTRWLVAILENHQQPDGSVRVPGRAGAVCRKVGAGGEGGGGGEEEGRGEGRRGGGGRRGEGGGRGGKGRGENVVTHIPKWVGSGTRHGCGTSRQQSSSWPGTPSTAAA